MKEERIRFKKCQCPYCGCQLLSVIKPKIGNTIIRKKLYYCPDCEKIFTENCKEIFTENDELIESSGSFEFE